MDHVSMTWLMLYELRTDDREMHFSDFDPTEKITERIPKYRSDTNNY